ncbi:MAG TPA: polyprenyl synthetase family protein [Methanoregulaceae archaeon]|nr:polyprenyl synthetase family protein [Methanolinea sp.]MDD3091212.1 polyprenyl synthetase family protein [Methanoregulaceae archaeon]MDD5047325.1 polyprenyl synthetase family protein [Methanoregulaceae archaeon]MDD5684165.1 polyprenyl synthetase family protein [Methanoregulaceae archaeon]HOP67618.1 polyprenyl synthetase family protein [Methanoregulaceae archaeon]
MDLTEYLEQTADNIDRLIHRYFGSSCEDLGRASAHLLTAGGKRLRPALLMLAADAVRKGSSADVMPAALALELTHSFTLIHDDIMDGDATRRGVPTVHTRWDEPTAILAGDVLFASAFEFLSLADCPDNTKVRSVTMLARTCVEICEGQHLDMSFEGCEEVTEGDYLKMVEKKTGALYAASAGIGAILAGGNDAQVQALYQFGRSIGMAFQVQDDVIDLVASPELSGKDRASDLREGKKTLINIRAADKGIDLSGFRRELSDEEIDSLISRLESLGVIGEVRQIAFDLVKFGKQRISILPESDEKRLLCEIGDHFVTRGF